jgi:hypothetical protein
MNLPNSHTFPSGISVGAYLMAGVSVVGAGVIAASPFVPPAPTPVQAAAVVSPPEPVAPAPAPESAAAQPARPRPRTRASS